MFNFKKIVIRDVNYLDGLYKVTTRYQANNWPFCHIIALVKHAVALIQSLHRQGEYSEIHIGQHGNVGVIFFLHETYTYVNDLHYNDIDYDVPEEDVFVTFVGVK